MNFNIKLNLSRFMQAVFACLYSGAVVYLIDAPVLVWIIWLILQVLNFLNFHWNTIAGKYRNE